MPKGNVRGEVLTQHINTPPTINTSHTFPEQSSALQLWSLSSSLVSVRVRHLDAQCCTDCMQIFGSRKRALSQKPPDGYVWSGERLTRKQLTSRPDHFWPKLWKSMGKHAKAEGEAKSGLKERSTLKTHENCEEFISSTQRIRNSKKPSRTRVRSWKHQLLLLCPVKLWRIVGVVHPTKLKTKLVCILKVDESTRMRMGNSMPHCHQDHFAGKRENSLQHYN